MERAKFTGPSQKEQQNKALEHDLELKRAISISRETGAIDIIAWPSKPGITCVSVVTSDNGASVHMVNAVATSRVVLADAARIREYPDIIVDAKNYNLKTILKKFSEYLFLKHELQDIKINAYKNARSFKAQKPIGIFEPQTGIIAEIAA